MAGLSSPAMRHAVELCRLYGRVRRPVLCLGPVGAGKTMLARELHRASGRKGRFVAIGSGELSETLFADTLFGHTSGAFTGAASPRKGAYAEAAGGSLLLDDLAVMPVIVQAALLRVLDDGWFRPLGATKDERADCRMVFASTLDPSELVGRGDLLPDLESRLGELVISVPPLRQRKEDIVPMATAMAEAIRTEHGTKGHVHFSQEVQDLLLRYPWPTNVRELRAVTERAVIHAGMHERVVTIQPAHLPDRIRTCPASNEEAGPELSRSLVESVLREVGGNQSEAARRLGVHRNTVARYLRATA